MRELPFQERVLVLACKTRNEMYNIWRKWIIPKPNKALAIRSQLGSSLFPLNSNHVDIIRDHTFEKRFLFVTFLKELTIPYG